MNNRAKHIDIWFHFTQEALSNKSIGLFYSFSNSMVADMVTKALARLKHARLRDECWLHLLDI